VRELRLVGEPLSLWDVLNVEAHVKVALDAALDKIGARLNPQQYARAYTFCWELCWELSGLQDDTVTPRHVWEVHGFYAPRTPSESFRPIKLQQFPSEASALSALAGLRARAPLSLARVLRARPTSSYDPGRGLRFSTYSRGLITLRVADWYRQDPEFGDTRYESGRGREESLEALGEQLRGDDTGDSVSWLDRHSPGGRLDFVDQLNPHAYADPIEEVLHHATLAR
jgi:hypothetical protein